jgi:response regulator RpfG family c-di-GMP phosphodiesterase
MSTRVLLVDDEPNVLTALRRTVADLWETEIATSGAAALSTLREGPPFSVVVADQKMPGLSGVEVLAEVAKFAPNTVRVMLSGNADKQTAVDAVNQGKVFRYLSKPCDDQELIQTLTAAIEQYELLTSRQDLLEKTLSGTLGMLSDVLAMVDPAGFGLAQRVRQKARMLCKQGRYEGAWQIEVGAMLAHVGIVSIPGNVSSKMKSGQLLSEADKELLYRLPKVGYDLIRKVPYLEPVAEIVLYQGKRFNGEGYPDDSVAGEAIPLGARVIKVLRDYEMLVRKSNNPRSAIETMHLRRGWYDPRILDDLFKAFAAESPHSDTNVIETTARCLRLGQILARNLLRTDNRVVVTAGTEVTPLVHSLITELATHELIIEPIQVYEDWGARVA